MDQQHDRPTASDPDLAGAAAATDGGTTQGTGAHGTGAPDEGAMQDLAARAGGLAEGSRAAVSSAIGEARQRMPELVDAGVRTLDQVAEQAPPAIEAAMERIDRSPTATLALATGACAGLAVGLLMGRLPRLFALFVAGVALVLAGSLISRRRDLFSGWD